MKTTEKVIKETKEWDSFKGDLWKKEINVSDFIDNNYKEYKGDESFLIGKSKKTAKVWNKCEKLLLKEIKKGLLDVDTKHVSGIDNFDAGYIDKKNEVVVGLQTDAPLKRIVNPFGGLRMVEQSLKAYGRKFDENLESVFATGIMECLMLTHQI